MRLWNHSTRICSRPLSGISIHCAPRISSTNLLAFAARERVARHDLRYRPDRPLGPASRSTRVLSSLHKQDGGTIYALSTAPGRAAIAIVRISGPAALNVYHALCPHRPAPKPRHATVRTLFSPSSTQDDPQVLDSGALVLYFPAPETATGEDVLELHVHGGTAVVKAVLAALPKSVPAAAGQAPAIRYAEPGEFTRRAFYNDRLDLTQIEALGDTLSAETEQQRRLAVRGSSSALADRYEAWRQKLLYARGELEALIDFSEDQHFEESPAVLCASVSRQVEELKAQLHANIENATRGELLRNGINVALIGEPNAGKSSLLNCIVGREAAIVSQEPGTTRDVVDVSVDIGGYLCRFGDLAGLRKAGESERTRVGEIESEGIRRARTRALGADVVIVILRVNELTSSVQRGNKEHSKMATYVEPEVARLLDELDPETQKVICVLNKTDILGGDNSVRNKICHSLATHPSLRRFLEPKQMPIHPISCKDAKTSPTSNTPDPGGIQNFLNSLTQLFSTMTSAIAPEGRANNSAWAESLGATERQRVLLQQCLEYLDAFLLHVQLTDAENSEEEIDIVLAAESLRAAADCLARITGRGTAGDVEEVLGVVFEKFCVGK